MAHIKNVRLASLLLITGDIPGSSLNVTRAFLFSPNCTSRTSNFDVTSI